MADLHERAYGGHNIMVRWNVHKLHRSLLAADSTNNKWAKVPDSPNVPYLWTVSKEGINKM
jgi:hypothetical protein